MASPSPVPPAGFAAGAGRLHPVEAIEDAREVIGGYAWAGVGDDGFGPALSEVPGRRDAPSLRR